MTTAAFRASYAEWKVIKTRATVQLVFEIPIEQADQAYQALGGMPIAAREVWCGIARLNNESEVMQADPKSDADNCGAGDKSQRPLETRPRLVTAGQASPVGADKPKFEDMPPAQQAGMMCDTESFIKFLKEEYPAIWHRVRNDGVLNRDIAAAAVREICEVNSRADITRDNAKWSALVLAYRLWMRAPAHGAA